MDAVEEMARNCFGYGRWDAPYWFIGLEEGMSGTLEDRIRLFREKNKDGLCDCKEFHLGIGVKHLHEEPCEVQGTWKMIMLILLRYLGKGTSPAELKAYQRECLGSANGQVALLELWGLPAKSLGAGVKQKRLYFSAKEEKLIRDQRRDKIYAKMREHTPEMVVMYGTTEREDFGKLAGVSQMMDWTIARRGSTILTLTPHAKSHDNYPDKRWTQHADDVLAWKAKNQGQP